MKLPEPAVIRLSPFLLCLLLAGCQSDKTGVTAVGQGYEEVKHSRHAPGGDAGQAQTGFAFLAADGKTLPIWPSLYGVDEVIHSGLAVFVGEMTRNGRGARATGPRLFVVRSPELPVDITYDVLWRWSKAAGKDFQTTLEKFSLVTPVEKEGRLVLQFDFWTEEGEKDWPDKAVLELDWSQVTAILQAVKQRGSLKKDPHWRTPFIGE